MMLEARCNKRLNFFKCYFVCLLLFDICRFFFFLLSRLPPKQINIFKNASMRGVVLITIIRYVYYATWNIRNVRRT